MVASGGFKKKCHAIKMKPSTLEKLRLGFRLLLGILLLCAAVSKLAKPVDFLGTVYAYDLALPRQFLRAVAVVLPWIELLCGLLLLGNIWPDAALICTTCLLLVFVVATAQAWARGLDISCGCFDLTIFGLNKSHPGLVQFLESVGFAFIRNLLLTAMAVFLLRARLAELKAAAIPQRPLTKQERRAAERAAGIK